MDGSQDQDQDQMPQQMGQRKMRPYEKPGTAGQTVADIERQERIERLRQEERDKEIFDEPVDKPKKKRRFLRFMGWMFLIVLLTAGGAAAGWYFWLRKEPRPAPAVVQQTAPAPPPAAAEEPTNTHTSTAFLLQFDYPQTWKVTDNPDNTITAVSPSMKLKLAAGKTQTGQIVMTVRHKQISLPEFKNGNATAIRESEKIDYAKPSQAQRASTYVSFLNYADSKTKGIDGVYVTGDNGYTKDQDIPLTDIAKSDPLITITFRGCIDEKCSAPADALTVAASAWDDPAFVKPIKSTLQSIVAE